MRLNIGCGMERFSNCINLDKSIHKYTDPDILAEAEQLPFKAECFTEVLMLHVIEHIPRIKQQIVLEEVWRVLEFEGRFILHFPDFIECAKRFIENRNGKRWEWNLWTLYGRQAFPEDFHVTAMEKQDFTERLWDKGFKDIKYKLIKDCALVTCKKGEILNAL